MKAKFKSCTRKIFYQKTKVPRIFFAHLHGIRKKNKFVDVLLARRTAVTQFYTHKTHALVWINVFGLHLQSFIDCLSMDFVYNCYLFIDKNRYIAHTKNNVSKNIWARKKKRAGNKNEKIWNGETAMIKCTSAHCMWNKIQNISFTYIKNWHTKNNLQCTTDRRIKQMGMTKTKQKIVPSKIQTTRIYSGFHFDINVIIEKWNAKTENTKIKEYIFY